MITENIQALLDSNISAYKIQKETGVSRTTITNYRNGTSDILNMSLDYALKLENFWLKIKNEQPL